MKTRMVTSSLTSQPAWVNNNAATVVAAQVLWRSVQSGSLRGSNPLVDPVARQRAQNLFRWLADDVAQFSTRQRRVAIRQEYPENRIDQRQVFVDVSSLLAAVDLQNVLQPVDLRHLTCLLVYPVNLFRIKVFAKDLAVFLAKVGSQLHADM
jgi:hypothetical protein